MNAQKIIHLTPPQLSDAHIKEYITCIRAHRERIFNVSTQLLNDKLIFHNYGQGGAGWTFLFGCVNESIREFEKQIDHTISLKNKSIAVIGTGCYGLLTAIILARKGFLVRIIAKETQDIPSYKAAGFFFPRARKSSTPQERASFESFGMESYRNYLSISNGTHPFFSNGAQLLPAYYGLDIDPGFTPYIQNKLIDPPQRVTIDFANGKAYDAMEYKTIFINATTMMQELERMRKELAIPITRSQIMEFGEIPESIVFNCAGMGAKKLTSDTRIIPVQGHLITLKNQPQLQYMINVKVIQKNPLGRLRDELIYFSPKDEGILGITFLRGQDDLSANQHEFERLLQRCREFF